jgi:hypothetical protein
MHIPAMCSTSRSSGPEANSSPLGWISNNSSEANGPWKASVGAMNTANTSMLAAPASTSSKLASLPATLAPLIA